MELDCLPLFWASQVAQWSKNPPGTQEIQETSVRSLGRKIPWRREWQPTPGILAPGNPMDRGAWWATVHRVTKTQTLQKVRHDRSN